MASFTLKLPTDEQDGIRRFFAGHGFEMRDANYAFWQARGPGCNATFYKSGKLLLQGKEADVWRGLLGDETPDARPYHRALSKHPIPVPAEWIGTDEAGKGDYFGPLVVAGVSLKRADLEILSTLGIDDSKAIADDRMPEMETQIRALADTEVIVLRPAKYNDLYDRFGNLNKLLAWAHGRVIENLLERGSADFVLIDKFAHERVLRRGLGTRGRAVRFAARTKAEEDPAVAAASILARSAYVRGIKALSRRFGVRLRLGAGAPTVASAHEFVAKHGKAALSEVAKVHFSTTDKL